MEKFHRFLRDEVVSMNFFWFFHVEFFWDDLHAKEKDNLVL